MRKRITDALVFAVALSPLIFFNGPAATSFGATGIHDGTTVGVASATPDAIAIAQLEKTVMPPNTGAPLTKAVTVTFDKAFIVFGAETLSATGAGTARTIATYHRKDGKPWRLSVDWLAPDVSTPELDQIATQKTFKLELNGAATNADVMRLGQHAIRTSFEVPDQLWPIHIRLLMYAPEAVHAQPTPSMQVSSPVKPQEQSAQRPSARTPPQAHKESAGAPAKAREPIRSANAGPPASHESAARPADKKLPTAKGPSAPTYKYVSATIQISRTQFDYFEAHLYSTFKHPRCTTCHIMGSPEAIKAQHTSNGVIPVQTMDVKPDDPSICSGCHLDLRDATETNDKTPAKFLGQLGTFTDYLWRSPSFSKNINWKTKKDANDVCTTVVAHLKTTDAVHKHFHNDARIAWAVSASDIVFPALGGTGQPKDSAPPGSYAAFMKLIDNWIDLGIPCKP